MQKNEYEEQQTIEQIALSRHSKATGVKEIRPFLMTNEEDDAWLVILTTANEFEFITTLVTAGDISGATQ